MKMKTMSSKLDTNSPVGLHLYDCTSKSYLQELIIHPKMDYIIQIFSLFDEIKQNIIFMNNNFGTYQQTDSLIPGSLPEPVETRSSNKSFLICFMLYFLQGNVAAIGRTMPYMYKELPSYLTLALFSTIDLPFSFKFLLSPFLQKYTNLDYGKRKTWIIISQTWCSLCLLVSSFFTDIASAATLAMLLMISQFFITIQDISLDSLSIKQLRCPHRTSMIQSVAQPFGVMVGSLLLLKLTSQQFADKIGLMHSITTPQFMMRGIAVLLLVSATIMHFVFKETKLDCELRGNKKSIWQIISYSKTFFHLRSKYCRLALFFLMYYQGLKFYEAGYDYQLVKAGFSRDTSNSISNMITLPVLGLTFFMAEWITRIGNKYSLIITLAFLSLLYSCIIIVFPLTPYVIVFTQFSSTFIITLKNMVLYILINSFPMHGLSGMFITILLSVWNIGELKTLNTLSIDYFGWKDCAIIGVILQLIIIFMIPRLLVWIEEGEIEIDASISQEQPVTFSAQIMKQQI